ncbi:MAG: Ribosome hibernation promoting factor [Chlamydiales bacterium]|nr:Ribosome hibernation promoting factor [Chlamydiales bacterium]MCH9619367.1 Ribosome hibernation promoting factor [Chlamydiales bacterium]MCH9622171.1 Ribosome hibernation promoting factor [Chlamydiales bacterium]
MSKSKAEIRQKFEGNEFPVHVLGRHVSITEPMKKYAVDKLTKIERFGGRVMEAYITMDIQKLTHQVDIILTVNNIKIKVSGKSRDMYASIDEAIEKLKNKLTRYIHRIHEHHAKGVNVIDLHVNIIRPDPIDEINDEIEEENLRQMEESMKPGEVVSKEKRALKTLSQEEAIMKMALSEEPFIVYRCEVDRKLKVIYRREEDRNYGIIQLPE